MKLDESKMIKILMVSIVLVIIVALILIIVVWKMNVFDNNRNEQISTLNEEIGNFSYVTYDYSNALNKYVDEMNKYIYNADIDTLFNLLSDSYKENFSYTKELLYSNLSGKGVLGKKFINVEYTMSTIESYRIYAVSMTSEDLSVTFNYNIIEESPNRFTYSLDNYILSNKKEKKQKINGIEIIIKNIDYCH